MSSLSVFIPSRYDQVRIETKQSYSGPECLEAPAVIIAHPYGPLGGTMDNNVVSALHHYFDRKGYVVIRMNFRGSGRSEGRTSWTGMAEREDYDSVVDYLLSSEDYVHHYPKVSTLLFCGYSFGSMIASSLNSRPSVPCSYLLISFPLSVLWALATVKSSYFKAQAVQLFQHYATDEAEGHVLIVYGDRDQFTASQSYQTWLADHCKGHVQAEIVQSADHFWSGYERQLVTRVDHWLSML
ncbi:Alpha/Beta hydrolase protein [Spinellus fusiger]|nr:Alpha/Beta hydrolase protein [Spinellus fusiger]